MKIAICDDEKSIRDHIEKCVKETEPNAAVEEYVFEAFDVGAVQYIVKPFDRNKLIDTIKKSLDLANERKRIETALSDKNESEGGRTFLIKSGGLNKKAAFTDERIDKLLHMYASSSQDYAQAYLTYMSPADYLLLTTNRGGQMITASSVQNTVYMS